MRIALVSLEYPPFHGGGIGTYAEVMSAALARHGHEVHVVTNRFDYGSTDPVHAERVHCEGNLWVHRITGVSDDWQPLAPHDCPQDLGRQLHTRWSPFLYYAELVSEELARLHGEHRFDVAEFPECAAEGYGVIRRKRLRLGFLDLPVTVTLHSPIDEIHRYNLQSRCEPGFLRRAAMEDYCIRHADAVNAPSRLLAGMVRERLGLVHDERPWDVMPLPMDFTAISGAAADIAAGPEPWLLFVGRLEPRKGVKYLVDAAVRVMERHPALRVVLIGRDAAAGEAPGSMADFLRLRIPERLRARFEFAGPLPRERLFGRYAAATACVFPAPWDNFPLACAEAMASGACVIGGEHSGMADMIEHERSGLLVRAGDVGALAAAITHVLEDRALAARLRAAAPARIRAVCDPDAAVRSRVAHYERALAAHRAVAPLRPVVAPPRGRRLAVLVPHLGDAASAARSAASVRAAAEHAGLAADVSVIGARAAHDDADVHRRWLARLAADAPDLVMTLWPGDTVEREFLAIASAALEAVPDAAWASTWSLPVEGAGGEPYAATDFVAPLDMLRYTPPPAMLVRHEALDRVGGWNLELPPGWRDWDLLLAFAEAGLEGLVVPLWLAHHAPRPEAEARPLPWERTSVVLDALVARSPGLFARHGATLWRHRVLHSVESPADDGRGPWAAWWVTTKACLARQYPRAARLWRRFVKGGSA